MKRVKLLVAIVLAVFIAAFTTTAAAASLPNGTILSITQGAGSGLNTPCSTGSCFGMSIMGGWTWTDFGPGTDGGIVLGKDQITGQNFGQEWDGTDTNPGELSSAWFFFNNYGVFLTAPICAPDTALVGCAPTDASANVFSFTSCVNAADCLGKTTLGTWNEAWNGVVTPLGSALGCQASPAANCVGVTSWTLNPNGGSYELRYSWAVPNNDPSGFGNVPFGLILRGTVSSVCAGSCCGVSCPNTDCRSAGVCNPGTGLCAYTNVADGTACTSDNNVCTNDICQGGVCQHVAVTNGTLCDADSNKCTGTPNTTVVNDVCTNGVCVPGPLKVCTGTNTCKNYGMCIPATGSCPAPTNKPVSTPCDDGNACTLNDICTAGGICKGTANYCRDTDPCTQDACTAGTGACTHTPMGTPGVCGQPCPNPIPVETKLLIATGQGSATNVPCSVGSCFSMVNGTDAVWTDILPGTDGGFWVGHPQASGGQELPGGGSVSTSGALTAAWNFFSAEGTFFTTPDGGSLNKFCGTSCLGYDCLNKTELKVFTVAWNGGTIPMGSAAGCVLSNCSIQQNNDVMVNDWQIDPVSGSWSMNYSKVVPVGSFSNVNFHAILRGVGGIVACECCVTPGLCDMPPDQCHMAGICNSSAGVCVYPSVANGTACNDGNACTTGDVCNNGVCIGTPGVICTALDQCHIVGVCDPSTGICSNPPKPNGTPCDDGNACTVNDVCSSGVCSGTLMNCNDGDACTVDACAGGTCTHALNCSLPGCSTDPRCCFSNRPLPAGTVLTITPGSGSDFNTPCSAGSCFSMMNGLNLIWINIAPGTDGGIIIGTDQFSGSQEWDGTITDPGGITAAWNFFNAYGTFATAPMCSPDTAQVGCAPTDASANKFASASCVSAADCLGKTTLGTWNVAWNGVAAPVGSALACPLGATNCGVTSWNLNPSPAINGGSYELRYSSIVPNNDPSGFGNVPFGLILRGNVTNSNVVDTCLGVTCAPATDCKSAGLCNPCSGVCEYANKADGTACTTDNNPCTTDICQSGTCQHVAVASGTACNADNNLCTGTVNNTLVNDTCTNGVCVAGPLKVCTGTNTCKNYGTCIPATGYCPAPTNKAVGTACNDGNACTVNDVCAAGGVCKGTTNLCRDSDVCTLDLCDTSTGACTHSPMGTLVCGQACPNPLPANTKLPIAAGQGSGTNVPCSVGSCFSMVNGTDIIWTDIAPGTDGGFWIGHSQASGGQENVGGGEITTSGALTAAWSFFNAYGTFMTMPDGGTKNIFCGTPCQGADCIHKTELKVFNAAWNNNIINMGSEAGCVLSNCTDLQKNGVNVNDWQIDSVSGSWSMDYAQVVPTGSFSNVKFHLILRGPMPVTNPCANAVNGTPCDDGNACTMGDSCQGGVCMPGTPLNCNDNNACTTDYCDPATGCNHKPVVCPLMPISVCQTQICDPARGCLVIPVPNGTNCDDGNLCNGVSTCQSGVCTQTVPPVTCDPATDCKYAGVCNTATGVCNSANKPTGTPCPIERLWLDPSVCYNDYCANGVCTMHDLSCDDNNVCTTDTCNRGTGTCTNTANTLPCNDNNPCTQNDTCSNKVCVGTPIVCAVSDQCHLPGICDPATGSCSNPIKPNGSPCNDGNACTAGDVCNNGSCAGIPVVCTATDQCHVAGTCDPSTGACSYPSAPDGTRCNDNNPCTFNDVCVSGTCKGIPASCPLGMTCDPNTCSCVGCLGPCVICTSDLQCSSGRCDRLTGTCVDTLSFCKSDACTTSSCDPASGCVNTPVPNGTACNDGNACTVGDTCQAAVCTPGAAKVCAALDQCHTAGICDPASGVCSNPIKTNGSACNDGKFCTLTDTCQNGACTGSGTPCAAGQTCDEVNHCVTINKCAGVVCNDGNTCHTGTCNTATGLCSYSNKPSGTACDDGNVCTSNDKCNSSGVCKGTNNTASCNDGNACTTNDRCSNGVCKGTAKTCNDGNACTTDTCNTATGLCVYTPIVCNDNNECTTDSCDPKSGCKYTPKANGTACTDDGNLCTTDTCQGGKCTHTARDCNDHNICTADSCNTATGTCVHTFNKPTTVTLIGDQPSGETSAQNLQIQTKFTVTNGGCVVSTSGNNKVYFSAGSSVDVNSKVGAGPNPTTIKLDNASQSTAPASSTITCPSATTTHSLYLDNLKASGGKDKDNLFIYGNAQD